MRFVLFETLIESELRDSLARALRARGHKVFCPEPVWRGAQYPSSPGELALCEAAVDSALAWKPDVFFNFRPSALPPDVVRRIAKGGIRTVVWLSDDPVLYRTTYRHIVESYEYVLHCGEEPILEFYQTQHGIAGVNFPFWTDQIACPRQWGEKLYDIAFLGNCRGAIRQRRYSIISALPGEKLIFGQVGNDPLGISMGRESDHRTLMARVGAARIGFNIPQIFLDYRGSQFDFPQLARLGSFPVPSRVVQYAALGLPILTYGRVSAPPWFPEMITGRTIADCIREANRLLSNEEFRNATADAVHRRFLKSYTADRRAAFLDWLLSNDCIWRGCSVAERASLYDRFSSAKVDSILPKAAPVSEQIAVLRRSAEQLSLSAKHPARILVIGAALNGPTDIVACHIRALRALGHVVLHINPFRDRSLLPSSRIARGGYGSNVLDAKRIGQIAAAFKADVIVTLAGGFGFDMEGASSLRAAGYVLVGVTLSDPDVLETVIEHARYFDIHFTNSRAALAIYHSRGLHQTFLMPFAIDRAWVAANLDVPAHYHADVICLGNATSRPERNACMLELAKRFNRVRAYGKGWDLPNSNPVRGLELLRAARGGLLHVNFPRTMQGHTNIKCGVFETIGSGGLLLTERFDELGELFTYDREIISYDNVQDLGDKIEWLLANPDERDAIRLRAMGRLLRQHLYEHRWLDAWPLIEQVHPDLAVRLKCRSAVDHRIRLVMAGFDPSSESLAEIVAIVRELRPGAEIAILTNNVTPDGTEQVRISDTAAATRAAAEADVVILSDRITPKLFATRKVSPARAFTLMAESSGGTVLRYPEDTGTDCLSAKLRHIKMRPMRSELVFWTAD